MENFKNQKLTPLFNAVFVKICSLKGISLAFLYKNVIIIYNRLLLDKKGAKKMRKNRDRKRESNRFASRESSFFAHEFNTYTLEKLLCKRTAVSLFC